MSTELPGLEKERREAIFSADRKYRYTLEIVWRPGQPLCQFIGLNPSTADEVKDDPTLRRVKAFAKSWGYGGIIMTNLFAFRATLPGVMKSHAYPVGEAKFGCPWKVNTGEITRCFSDRNDAHLLSASISCALTIAAWGNHGKHMKRDERVKDLIKGMKCFRLTGKGCPEHPLYLPASTTLIDFN